MVVHGLWGDDDGLVHLFYLTNQTYNDKALATTVDFVARVFPHLDPTPTHTLTCLYSVTPDHDFVLDAHPTMPNVSKCACADPICNLVVPPT